MTLLITQNGGAKDFCLQPCWRIR